MSRVVTKHKKMIALLWLLPLLAGLVAKETVHYHTYYGTQLTTQVLQQHENANTTFWCTIGVKPCDALESRRLDGSCNNLQHPSRGARHTPYLRLLPPAYSQGFEPRPAHDGGALPLSRRLRTSLLTTGLRSDPIFTVLATHFFAFAVTDVTSIHDTVNFVTRKPPCCQAGGSREPDCVPQKVPADDPVHRFSGVRCLNLTRPASYQSVGCLKKGTTPQRITTSTPTFDLSCLYGNVLKVAVEKGRLFQRGLLKYDVDSGRVFPPAQSGPNQCVLNQPPHETRCHDTPEPSANTVFGNNILTIWLWRNHNRVASTLADLNPCWDDEKLFQTARDINIATFVQILYYEFLPILLGYENMVRDGVLAPTPGFRDSYDENEVPQISLEFPYVLRWYHHLQDGRLKMYDGAGNYLKQMPIVNLTLRTGYLAVDDNIDYITQGSFRQPSAKNDYTVDPDISNICLGPLQQATDVFTNDLTKGRYFGFQPYIKYKEYCNRRPFKTWDDLVGDINYENVELLKDAYQHVNDIDLVAGLWMEGQVRGGYAPALFYCLASEQLKRSVVSDRHWYERPNRPNAFSLRQLSEVRKASISRLLCDVGDKVSKIQPRGFMRAGPTNKMVSCDSIPKMDLTAWKDYSCKGTPY